MHTADPIENRGALVIRTIAMPQDTNANGDMFGGWMLSQMDLGGALLAKEHSRSRVVTVAIFSMVFLESVKIGDTVSCYAHMQKVGNTSMQVKIEAWVRHWSQQEERKVTEGLFTYVAIDASGKPQPVHAWKSGDPHPG